MYSVFTTILLSLAMCPQNIWGKGDEASYKALETLAKGIYYLETMYVDEKAVDTKQLVDNALIGMAEKLDPHTVIMPRKAFEQLAVDTKGKFGGVGIIVSHESGQRSLLRVPAAGRDPRCPHQSVSAGPRHRSPHPAVPGRVRQ